MTREEAEKLFAGEIAKKFFEEVGRDVPYLIYSEHKKKMEAEAKAELFPDPEEKDLL